MILQAIKDWLGIRKPMYRIDRKSGAWVIELYLTKHSCWVELGKYAGYQAAAEQKARWEK